jgi:hypothetical protein
VGEPSRVRRFLDGLALALGLVGGCIAIFQFLVSDSVSGPWVRSLFGSAGVPSWFAALSSWSIETRGDLPLWVTVPGVIALFWLSCSVALVCFRVFHLAGRGSDFLRLILYGLVAWMLWGSIPIWVYIASLVLAFGILLVFLAFLRRQSQ